MATTLEKDLTSLQRFAWVDYAKAVGIILVVYGHVSRGLVNAGIMLDSPLYRGIDSIIYSFHMPLFFFLSGLFLISTYKSKGFNRGLGSKVDTIVYPYILWSLLQGGVEVTLSSYTNGDVSSAQVLSLFTEPRAQFWFLYALFFVFLLSFSLLLIVGVNFGWFLFLLSVILYLSPIVNVMPVNINFLSNNLVFFLMGSVFQQARLINFNNGYIFVLLLLLAVAGHCIFHQVGLSYSDKNISLLALSMISLMAVISFSEWLSHFKLSFIAYVGVSSMAIYLMHILAGSGVRVILSKYAGIDSVTLHMLMGIFMGVFLPLVALRLIDYYRIPYLFNFPISQNWFKARGGS
jgi:fucose 4-O-acetylase-like acetyltransferase